MADNLQIQAKKASHYLAWGGIIYSIISTFLYIKFQTNLEDYITWWIVIFCVMTVILAYTKRGLYNYLINNPYLFSFSKKEEAITESINVPAIHNDTSSEVNDSTKEQVIDNANNSNGFLSNLSDAYEKSLKEHNEKNAERKKLIFEEVTKYCFYILAPFLSKEDISILLENINHMIAGNTDLYKQIRSNADNPLKSSDIRHLGYNIKSRLNVSKREISIFLKKTFPYELRDASIETIERNLRDTVSSTIKIDIPDDGDYHFKTLNNSHL